METTSEITPLRAERRDAVAALVLALIVTAALGRMLLAPADVAPGLLGEDGRTQWLPWREYGFGWLRSGVVPLWNPHVLCGTPFVGGWQSALFYPPNALFLALPVGAAARWSVWLHWLLAAVATYALARSVAASRAGAFLAAVAFTLGAPHMLRAFAGHWGAVCALPWLPLALLAADQCLNTRRSVWALLGALAVAMQWLSGAPHYLVFGGVAVALYVVLRATLDRRTPGRARLGGLALIAIALVAGTLLAAVQVFPGVAASRWGARSLSSSLAWRNLFSWPVSFAVTFLVPWWEGGNDFQRRYFWEFSTYLGAAAPLLAAVGIADRRRGGALAFTALLLLLLALGPFVGLFDALAALGGPFASLRSPAKFLGPLSLMVCLLAALGLTRLEAARRLRWAVWPIVALTALNMVLYAWPHVGPRAWFRVRGEADRLFDAAARTPPDARFLAQGPNLNDAMRIQRDTPEGIEPGPPRWFHEVFCRATGRPVDIAPSLYQAMPVKAGAPFGRLLHMAGVQRLVLRPGEESAHPVVEDTAEARVCRYADALPRAFIVHRGRRVKDEAESLRATFEADLTREVVLPADTPDPPAVGLPPSDKDEVRWQRLGPNRIMAFPRMASPGWMVLTESWSPGWEAHTGLGRTPVLRANHAFMAVALPAGTHVVSLVYRPRAFFVGAWTSGATLLALAAWAAGLAVKAAVERRKGGAA